MTYNRAIIFTKYTDLMPYWEGKRSVSSNPKVWDNCKSRYQYKRDVSLILQIRYEVGSHMICRIKCPINPLPTKGEFKVCHLGAIIAFLAKEGWEMKGSYSAEMFK